MKIALLGDIALIGKYDLEKNSDAKLSLENISNFLKQYDYVIGNLESPLTNQTTTKVCKSMHLRSNIKNVELLKYLNIRAVSLANNHSYDYGRKGVDETIGILENNDIEYLGIDGKNILINNISVSGFCCYSTNAFGYNSHANSKGINALSYNNVLKQVESDKKANNLSLLSLHWGDEHTNYPRYDHVKFARLLAEKNDVVISGHHPHVTQGIEQIGSSVIAYSQGNFCFDDCAAISGTGMVLKQNDENRESFILEVTIEGNKIQEYKAIGIREINGKIILDPVSDKLSIISSSLKDKISEVEYQKKRVLQFSNPTLRLKKFGAKNFKWYVKRLNYYSIGAFILAKFNAGKYQKLFSSHL
ncbi:MAG: CapA family protein [Syntrophales bacterium]